jgi:hypothetical protein
MQQINLSDKNGRDFWYLNINLSLNKKLILLPTKDITHTKNKVTTIVGTKEVVEDIPEAEKVVNPTTTMIATTVANTIEIKYNPNLLYISKVIVILLIYLT